MTAERPLGVKLIAAYFFVKAAALILAATIVNARPDLHSEANEFISVVAFKVVVPLPYLTALLDVAVGLGIWFLKRWSRTLFVLINGYGLCRMAIGSAALWELDRKYLFSQTSSPYFAVNLVAGTFILFYLLNPDVKQLFGEQE